MRAAALAGVAGAGAAAVGAGVLIAELDMGRPLSSERNYQGTDFKIPKRTTSAAVKASRTAQVSREMRRRGDGLAIWEYSFGAFCDDELERREEKKEGTSDNNRRGARS